MRQTEGADGGRTCYLLGPAQARLRFHCQLQLDTGHGQWTALLALVLRSSGHVSAFYAVSATKDHDVREDRKKGTTRARLRQA